MHKTSIKSKQKKYPKKITDILEQECEEGPDSMAADTPLAITLAASVADAQCKDNNIAESTVFLHN